MLLPGTSCSELPVLLCGTKVSSRPGLLQRTMSGYMALQEPESELMPGLLLSPKAMWMTGVCSTTSNHEVGKLGLPLRGEIVPIFGKDGPLLTLDVHLT